MQILRRGAEAAAHDKEGPQSAHPRGPEGNRGPLGKELDREFSHGKLEGRKLWKLL